MRYLDALKEARAQLMGREDDREITIFRVYGATSIADPEYFPALTEAMLGAVAMAYDEMDPFVVVERQRGGKGPFVQIRKVTVTIETTDPEVRDDVL